MRERDTETETETEQQQQKEKKKGGRRQEAGRRSKKMAKEGWGLGGSHCCQVVVRVSSRNPGSESLERMMSLGDPKIRLHSTICRSRGS